MPKKSTKQLAKEHQSPLTRASQAVDPDIEEQKKARKAARHNKKSQKRARKEAEEDDEEQRLTSLLFGSAVPSAPKEFQEKRTKLKASSVAKNVSRDEPEEDGFSFQIDRSGEDVNDDDEEESPLQLVHKSDDDAGDGSSSDDDNDEEQAAAWLDEDDDNLAVDIVGGSDRLKKLRKSRDEEAASALTADEFEKRLRKRFEESTQSTAVTEWAKIDTETSKRISGEDPEDDEIQMLASSSAPLLATSQHRLPPNILNMMRCPDANLEDPNKAAVQAVHFHPGSDPDEPLMLTAGLDKTLRFFQVGVEKSQKIHGIHFPKMPIYSASFLGDSGNVVASGRRPFFYMYDAVAGKVDFVPRINGRDERSWEKHVVSPDGKLIAFLGNDGYIVLVDAHSKHWIANLKMNGSVRAVSFTPDAKFIMASGSDGDVYRWDVNSRRCVERFSNNDGTITSALAAASKHMAVGAESGVVNIYSEHESFRNNKDPLKSVMNLKTSADLVRFNHDGQILAMSSRREKQSFKMLHVPTQTVFSNWPTSNTPINYAWSMDFSPESRFIAIGNDKGKCLLYRIMHYQD